MNAPLSRREALDLCLERSRAAGEVVGYRPDGLFARLTSLITTLRIAEHLDLPARFLWLAHDQGHNATHGYDTPAAALIDEPMIELAMQPPPTSEVTVDIVSATTLPGETEADRSMRIRELAGSLRLRTGQRLEDLVSPHTFSVGLHVRKGDSMRMRWLQRLFVPDALWWAILESILEDRPSEPVYLASNDPAFISAARDRWPGALVTAHDLADEPWAQGGLGLAMQDMLRLASSTEIIGPGSSALTSFAAVLRERPIRKAGDLASDPKVKAHLDVGALMSELREVADQDLRRELTPVLLAISPDAAVSNSISEVQRRLGRQIAAPPEVEQAQVLEVLGHFRPRTSPISKVRLGRDRDGGYVLPDDLAGIQGAISIGIGGDVSFDLALAKRGIRVLCVDASIEDLPAQHPLLTHVPMHWAERSGAATSSLADLVSMLGAEGDLLLKFDAEGAELACLPSLPESLLHRFRIIVGEFHGLDRMRSRAGLRRLRDAAAAVTAVHTCVHLHPNNVAPAVSICGVSVPPVIEATFLRNDRAEFAEIPMPIPGPLDQPNVRRNPEIVLTPWLAP